MIPLKGKYIYESGKLIPEGDMEDIKAKVKMMKLCFDAGPGDYGSFYFDSMADEYWHYIQNERYETEMKPVSREEASKKYPTVNFDRLLDIPR
jgi:hypothetical protein